jgi:hypothetical protein
MKNNNRKGLRFHFSVGFLMKSVDNKPTFSHRIITLIIREESKMLLGQYCPKTGVGVILKIVLSACDSPEKFDKR